MRAHDNKYLILVLSNQAKARAACAIYNQNDSSNEQTRPHYHNLVV